MQMIQPLCVDQHLQNAVDSTSYCLLNEGVLDPFTSGHINRFLFLILVSRWLVLCVDSHRNLLNVCSTVRLVLFSSQHCLFFSLVWRRKHSVAVWTVRQKKCPHTCWTFSVSVRWHSRPAEFTPVEITQRKAASAGPATLVREIHHFVHAEGMSLMEWWFDFLQWHFDVHRPGKCQLTCLVIYGHNKNFLAEKTRKSGDKSAT